MTNQQKKNRTQHTDTNTPNARLMVCILCHCFFKYVWMPPNCTCVCNHHRCRTNPIKYWWNRSFVHIEMEARVLISSTQGIYFAFRAIFHQNCIATGPRLKCKCQNDIHWFQRGRIFRCFVANNSFLCALLLCAVRCAHFRSICGFYWTLLSSVRTHTHAWALCMCCPINILLQNNKIWK